MARENKYGYVKGGRAKNKSEYNAYQRRWYAGNKDKVQIAKLRWLYGLSEEDFNAILEIQDYKCAICHIELGKLGQGNRGRTSPCVDHDHTTKIVRGILCRMCNMALGVLGDSEESMKQVIHYLTALGYSGSHSKLV